MLSIKNDNVGISDYLKVLTKYDVRLLLSVILVHLFQNSHNAQHNGYCQKNNYIGVRQKFNGLSNSSKTQRT